MENNAQYRELFAGYRETDAYEVNVTIWTWHLADNDEFGFRDDAVIDCLVQARRNDGREVEHTRILFNLEETSEADVICIAVHKLEDLEAQYGAARVSEIA